MATIQQTAETFASIMDDLANGVITEAVAADLLVAAFTGYFPVSQLQDLTDKLISMVGRMDGTIILDRAPLADEGTIGSIAINVVTKYLYGPKTSNPENPWGEGTLLTGPQGDKGDKGDQGDAGADAVLTPALTELSDTSTAFGRGIAALSDLAALYVLLQRGNANGLASLGADGKLTIAQLPDAVVGAVKYQSAWNASTNSPAIPTAATGNRGWYYRVSVAGSTNISGITDWKIGDWIISNGSAWEKVDNTDQVTSVAGQQGAVVLTSTDLTDSTAAGRALLTAANVAAQRTALQLGGAATLDVNTSGGVQGFRQELLDIATESTAFGRDLLNYNNLDLLQADIFGGYLDDLSSLKTAIAGSAAVKIACFGDSTTDGNGTSGWSANPTSGGAATGTTNHGASGGANAWPRWFKDTLDEMFPGNAVSVWNAGYSGKSIYDGWAKANYVAAVVNNPAYGVPDFCFVQFGWNDDNGWTSARLTAYIQQTKETVRLIQSYGTKVILLVCDPGGRQEVAARNNRRVVAVLDAAKKAVATELGCAYLDHSDLMKSVFRHSRPNPTTRGVNGSQSRWFVEQPDHLHGGTSWHQLKASAIAALLNPNVVFLRPGERLKLQTLDSVVTYNNMATAPTEYLNGMMAQGGSFYVSSGSTGSNANTLRSHVWVDEPSTAVYRTVDDDNWTNGGGGSYPDTRSFSHTYRTSESYNPGHATADLGSQGAGQEWSPTDMPIAQHQLLPGLNLISYDIGNQAGMETYLGYWDLYSVQPPRSRNGLGRHGALDAAFTTGSQCVFLPEDPDLGNVLSMTTGAAGTNATILVDVDLPIGTGFIFIHNQAWRGGAAPVYGDKVAWMLFRNGDNKLDLHPLYTRGATVTYGSKATPTAQVALGTTADNLKLRITLSRISSNVRLYVHDAWQKGPNGAAQAYSSYFTNPFGAGTLSYPTAGVVGGLFGNLSSGQTYARINELTVINSPYLTDTP